MANSVDPDQTAWGAVWSGSTLFAYAILSVTLVYEIFGHLLYFCSAEARVCCGGFPPNVITAQELPASQGDNFWCSQEVLIPLGI